MEKDTNIKKLSDPLFVKFKRLFFGTKKRGVISAIGILIILFFAWRTFVPQTKKTQYTTDTVVRDTLVTSVTESGTVSVTNRQSVSTQATGVVSEVDVKDGDHVTQGEKIAVISLDQSGLQRQTSTYASYLAAKSSLDSANATLYSLQSSMYGKWNTFLNLATTSTYQNADGTPNTTNRTLPAFTQPQDDWLAAQAQYQNQQGVIAQAQAAESSAWLSYQQASSIITAPMDGTISDITITPGMQIASSGTSSSTTSSSGSTSIASQTIASIKTVGNPVISVSLSEIDATKVKSGQKTTVTFDALPNQTFTGKVLGINTTGAVSSGVTTYPAIIQLDLPSDVILPNMSATANVILSVLPDVLLVPSSAVQTLGGQSVVYVMQNGKPVATPVTIGASSDTQTEIITGLSEGQTIVTSTVVTTTSSATSSPFNSTLRFGGGGFGGGAIRTGGGSGGRGG